MGVTAILRLHFEDYGVPELFTIFFNAVAHKLERALLQDSHLAPRELELLSVLARTLSSRLPGWETAAVSYPHGGD